MTGAASWAQLGVVHFPHVLCSVRGLGPQESCLFLGYLNKHRGERPSRNLLPELGSGDPGGRAGPVDQPARRHLGKMARVEGDKESEEEKLK